MKIIHGRPRRPQSQGSVERANGDIQNILGSWMRTNKSIEWTKGLAWVNYVKNSKLNQGIKCSPYETVFGQPSFIGMHLY